MYPLRRVPNLVLVLLTCLLGLSCGASSPSAGLPASLWIHYSQREIDLILVDQAPPVF